MKYTRVNPESGFIEYIDNIKTEARSYATGPTGNVVVRDSITTTDPETGVATVFGTLPDGSIGFQPFVNDITPPPVPSLLSATSSAGTIIITWDGTFVDGESAPTDFQYCNVYGTRPGDVTPTLFGSVKNANDSVVAGADMVTAGDSWTFWATSLDYNKNESAPGVSTAPITIASVLDDSGLSQELANNQAAITQAQSDISTNTTKIATKSTISSQSTAPTGAHSGDYWLDTSNGNKAMFYNGTAWVSVQDAAINQAMTAANGKNTIFYQSAAPSSTGRIIGDLWFDTSNGNKPSTWSGTAWVSAQDAAIATAQAAANTAQTAANGKNTIISAASAPATTGHINGDVWFDTAHGNKPMVFSTNAWVSAQDASIATAQTAATNAQTSANGKNTIKYSSSAASGAGTTIGDVWFQTNSSGNIIGQWQWSGSVWVQQVIDNSLIAANIDAGKITAGYIAAARIQAQTITSTMIATDTITAGNIAAGAITASEISAGAVTATALSANSVSATAMVANTITAGQIAAGTITTNEIKANTITASDIAANTITASQIAASTITAGEIAANAVTATQIAANAVTASAIAANTITAAQIKGGTITANEMAVGTITAASGIIGDISADKISSGTINATYVAIGSGSNALPDPGFNSTTITNARTALSAGGTAGWTIANGASTAYRTATRTTASTNDVFVYLTKSNTFANAGQLIPVVAGQIWVMKVDTTTNISAGVRFDLYLAKADGTVSFVAASPFNTATGQRTISYTYTVPAGVTGMMIALACNTTGVTWTVHGNAFVGMQTTGDLLVNGAIDGKTITGAVVQTAATGARIVLNTAGLNGWDASGNNYLNASSSGVSVTGTLATIGSVSTSASTSTPIASYMGQVSIFDPYNGGPYRQVPGLGFTGVSNGQPLTNPNSVICGIWSPDAIELDLTSGGMGGSGGGAQIQLQQSDINVTAWNSVNIDSRGGVTINDNYGFGSPFFIGNDYASPLSLKLSLPTSTIQIPWSNNGASGGIVIPYRSVTSMKDFNDGYSATAGGVITVPYYGVYSITAGLGSGSGASTGFGLKLYIDINNSFVVASESPFPGGAPWINTVAAIRIRLNGGDTIRVRGMLTGPSTASTVPNSGETTYLTVSAT